MFFWSYCISCQYMSSKIASVHVFLRETVTLAFVLIFMKCFFYYVCAFFVVVFVCNLSLKLCLVWGRSGKQNNKQIIRNFSRGQVKEKGLFCFGIIQYHHSAYSSYLCFQMSDQRFWTATIYKESPVTPIPAASTSRLNTGTEILCKFLLRVVVIWVCIFLNSLWS